MQDIEKLIARFHLGHQSILESLDLIQSVVRSYQEAKPRILDLQDKLLAHFSIQNKLFFQELMTHFPNDRQSLKIIESLSGDINGLKIQTLEFFERHPADALDHHSAGFPLDFVSFSGEVKARIQIEEQYLLPLMEKADW